jgi:hypothetical protein
LVKKIKGAIEDLSELQAPTPIRGRFGINIHLSLSCNSNKGGR